MFALVSVCVGSRMFQFFPQQCRRTEIEQQHSSGSDALLCVLGQKTHACTLVRLYHSCHGDEIRQLADSRELLEQFFTGLPNSETEGEKSPAVTSGADRGRQRAVLWTRSNLITDARVLRTKRFADPLCYYGNNGTRWKWSSEPDSVGFVCVECETVFSFFFHEGSSTNRRQRGEARHREKLFPVWEHKHKQTVCTMFLVLSLCPRVSVCVCVRWHFLKGCSNLKSCGNNGTLKLIETQGKEGKTVQKQLDWVSLTFILLLLIY